MENMKFYEYAFSILSEAGHVITSSPVYVNHSSGETLYIDSSKDVVTNRFERDLLSLIDNVSLLVDVRWPGVVPELDENVQIYSATVDFSERCRSQNIADIHHLLQKYWNCTHSIVFFKNKEDFLISFADKDRSHILSDWFPIAYEWNEVVERVGIENIAIDTCEDYFLDFLYSIAREYCIRPVSFEEASFGLMPLDYVSKSLSSDIPLSREEIKNMIRDNLLFFEMMYGDDYVEPQYIGMEEQAYYHNISAEIDRISFELELEDTDGEEQFSFEDDLDDEDDDDIFDDYDEDIDPAIFDDPTLMVKWLEQQEKQSDTFIVESRRQEQERIETERREKERLEAERREQERLEAERREKERLEAERREQERLEAELRERERLEAERREQERLETERRKAEQEEKKNRIVAQQKIIAVLNAIYGEAVIKELKLQCERKRLLDVLSKASARKDEQERLEAERREQERLEAERRERERLEAERRELEHLEAERREQERLEAERREQERLEVERRELERIEKERQDLFKRLEQEHLQKLKELEEQYRSKKQSLGKQLSQIEGLQKEKEARLTKLTFLQFLEKRTLASELTDLDKKKQELLALIQTAESDYVAMRDHERMNFNLLLVEKGL